MAVERGYESQVGPAAPTPAPRADPNAFGASVGAGLEAVGDALHRLDTDSQAADFNARFAQLREAADNQSIDARKNAAAGAAGHAQQMKDWWEAQSAGMLDGIKDRRLQRSAQAQLAEFGARFNSSEYQWQLGRQAGKIVADQSKAADLAYNRAYRFVDQATLGEEFNFSHQGIHALQGISSDVKDKLISEHDAAATNGFFNGMIDRGKPKDALAILDTGVYDSILPKEQMQHLRNKAAVEINRLDAAKKAAATHDLQLYKKDLEARKAVLERGGGNPQDWYDLARDYEGIGEKAAAINARSDGTSMAATIGDRGSTPMQLDAEIAALTAKRNDGGLSVDQASRLNGLTKLRSQMGEMLSKPGGQLELLQFQTGKPIAPLDPNDPASMRARARQAQAAAATFGGVPEPLRGEELRVFRATAATGAQGKLQALEAIQGFGDPQVIRAAGAQIAGDDPAFRIASQLPPSVARSVLLGGETLKAAPQVLKPKPGAPDMRTDFNLWFRKNPVLTFLGGSFSNDVFEAAKAFYGQRAAEAGADHYDSGRFAEALETVLGRMPGPNGTTGGIARTPRGMVLVPQGMKTNAVEPAFARASEADYSRASGGRTAHWADGTKVSRTDLVKMLPTMLSADGHYGFRDSHNRLVSDDHGKPYVVDIRQLAK